jgi:hypothetical protein
MAVFTISGDAVGEDCDPQARITAARASMLKTIRSDLIFCTSDKIVIYQLLTMLFFMPIIQHECQNQLYIFVCESGKCGRQYRPTTKKEDEFYSSSS